MKTKHKLKLLKLLPECSEKWFNLKNALYLEAIGNPTWTVKIEPIEDPESEHKEEIFEIGEVVEVVDNLSSHFFKIGEHVKIVKFNYENSLCFKCEGQNNEKWSMFADEVKKLPKQEQTSKEFKVGDSVRVIENDRNVLDIGEIVRIIYIYDKSLDMNIYVVNAQKVEQVVSKHEIEHI